LSSVVHFFEQRLRLFVLIPGTSLPGPILFPFVILVSLSLGHLQPWYLPSSGWEQLTLCSRKKGSCGVYFTSAFINLVHFSYFGFGFCVLWFFF